MPLPPGPRTTTTPIREGGDVTYAERAFLQLSARRDLNRRPKDVPVLDVADGGFPATSLECGVEVRMRFTDTPRGPQLEVEVKDLPCLGTVAIGRLVEDLLGGGGTRVDAPADGLYMFVRQEPT